MRSVQGGGTYCRPRLWRCCPMSRTMSLSVSVMGGTTAGEDESPSPWGSSTTPLLVPLMWEVDGATLSSASPFSCDRQPFVCILGEDKRCRIKNQKHVGHFISSVILKSEQKCIPVGCVPPAHWPYLVVSHARPPAAMHAPGLQPHMPPTTMHAPWQPHMPPATTHATGNHVCPQQPCTPPATTHAPLPPFYYTRMPPPATTHALPLVHRITDACEHITLPQQSLRAEQYTPVCHVMDSLACLLFKSSKDDGRDVPSLLSLMQTARELHSWEKVQTLKSQEVIIHSH